MTLPLNSFVGEYRLIDLLGAGGMGEVYRAVHPKLGRVVAVKVLAHPGADTGFVERFLNEARIQAELQHPNIVTLYDFIERDGRPCIVMEYVDGQSLDQRIRACPCGLPLSEAIFIFRAVVEAIAYVHSRGVIHRDIKPNNVKISAKDEVKLLDFGVAKAAHSPHLTMTGKVIGTMQYLAPEQIKGRPADVRTDLWALGVLLYEMVTGRSPFEADTLGQVCERIGKIVFEPPSACRPALPHAIEAIILRCLRKDPADRYPTAQALLNDLERASASISAPRLHDTPRGDSASSGTMFASTLRLYWPAGLALMAVTVVTAIGLWLAVQSPSPRSAIRKGNDTAIVPPVDGWELRPVHIGVIGEPAQVYIRLDQGPWEGPHPTLYQFSAPLGKRITWKLSRKGYQDKTGSFNVQVVNEYYPRLCPVGTECPND